VESEYRIVAKYPTGYPIWLADLDREEKYVVLASGNHTIPVEERDPEKHGLYFFDTNGSLLWRYPTKVQIWGLGTSDDGKYMAAALMEPYGKVLLFDYKEGR